MFCIKIQKPNTYVKNNYIVPIFFGHNLGQLWENNKRGGPNKERGFFKFPEKK